MDYYDMSQLTKDLDIIINSKEKELENTMVTTFSDDIKRQIKINQLILI